MAGELSLCRLVPGAIAPYRAPGRGPLSYLPDPWAPSDLQGRDQKKKETTTF